MIARTICCSAIGLLIIAGCSQSRDSASPEDPYAHIADEQVRDVLRKAISAAGGIHKWRAVERLSYTKRSRLLLEDGAIEWEVVQRHEYQMRPGFTADISWEENGNSHIIRYEDGEAVKEVNGVPDSTSVEETVMSALYTLGMPYKLLDAGANLRYEGVDTLRDGTTVDVIKATYRPEEHQNHSTSDVWWYYFDRDDGSYRAAMVYHPPTYAYIENVEIHKDLPLRFNAHRKSYRSDSLRNIRFLRAEFWYSDFDILLDGFKE